ncbi:MAG: hypothetical protein HQL51_16990, partial [Magnetococcales bacterium]|nr:hypothetical protein [Magnetococcales bacterium]
MVHPWGVRLTVLIVMAYLTVAAPAMAEKSDGAGKLIDWEGHLHECRYFPYQHSTFMAKRFPGTNECLVFKVMSVIGKDLDEKGFDKRYEFVQQDAWTIEGVYNITYSSGMGYNVPGIIHGAIEESEYWERYLVQSARVRNGENVEPVLPGYYCDSLGAEETSSTIRRFPSPDPQIMRCLGYTDGSVNQRAIPHPQCLRSHGI